MLITIVLIFARMSAPAQQIQAAAQNFFFAPPSFEARSPVDADLTSTLPNGITAIAPPPGAVEVRNIADFHPGGGGVQDASFTLEAGSFTGISGPSGAARRRWSIC